MNLKQKEILRKVMDFPKGLMTQRAYLNVISDNDTKTAHALIAEGYIEETSRTVSDTGQPATFYRISAKGRAVFAPWYKRVLIFLAGDIRTIIVSSVVSLITALITAHFSH